MVYNGQQLKMKKIIGIVMSLATVVTLCSFVIVHNVNNDKTDNPEAISDNGEWEYYKPVTVFYYNRPSDENIYKSEYFIWKRTVCGEADYLLSASQSSLLWESPISKNYSCGTGQDWTSGYKYIVSTVPGKYQGCKGAFTTYLPGWD